MTSKIFIASIMTNLCFVGTAFGAYTGVYSHSAYVNVPGIEVRPFGSVIVPQPDPVVYDYLYQSPNGRSSIDASVGIQTKPGAAVSLDVDQIFSTYGSSLVYAQMDYSFGVENAPPLTSIPFIFSGNFYASQNGEARLASTNEVSVEVTGEEWGSSVRSYFGLNLHTPRRSSESTPFITTSTSNTPVVNYSQPDQYSINGSFVGHINISTNESGFAEANVSLIARTILNTGNSVFFASSLIDPHIEIDPIFLANNPGATFLIAEGVGNAVSPVPLPGAVWLLGSGLIALFGFNASRRV